MVTVTDAQVAVLRSFLVDGSEDEMASLREHALRDGGVDGFGALVYAAFVTAVRRRFSPTWSRADVIQYVADVRARVSEMPDAINPRAAENRIRLALNDQVVDDVDMETRAGIQVIFLKVLVDDAELDDPGIDELLQTARNLVAVSWPS